MIATAPSPVSDAELLRQYADAKSAAAFAALAGRYLPLIYSAAMRQTRDRHMAEDVAQATLIVLSQKAGGLDPGLLAGWLLKTTHYAARNAIRQRARRVAHEERAAAMRSENSPPAADADAIAWVIDPALARLTDADRTAVVLRYFQEKSFAEIAAQLQTTEAAAQRRIARAVEKLRGLLAQQGVAVLPAALPMLLAAQTIHPVPSSLAFHATQVAGSKAGSTWLIAKGALHAMAIAKVKVAVAIAVAALVVGVGVPTVYHFSVSPPASIPGPPPHAEVAFARPVSGSLPAGVAAEPVAVSRIADKRWFGVNGQPVDGVPVQLLAIAARCAPGATHAFCYHFQSPPGGSGVSSGPLIEGTGGYGSSSYTDPATGIEWNVIGFPLDPGSDAITLTVRATDRPIVTNAVVPAGSKEPVRGTIANHPLTANPPSEEGGKARFEITYGEELSDVDMTVYAIDTAGKKAWYSSTGLVNGKFGSRSYVFTVPLSALLEFHVESRPYNYKATYASVPLAPVK